MRKHRLQRAATRRRELEASLDAARTQGRQLHEWRRSAKKVTRAWNAWIAAEGRERAGRYAAYVAALADEERAAAEVEAMLRLHLEATDSAS